MSTFGNLANHRSPFIERSRLFAYKTDNWDCEFDPPSFQLKLLNLGDMYWFFPGKMLPCISALHWAR